MQDLQLSPRHLPELDPGFVPAALWNREFRRQAEASGAPVKLALVLERAHGPPFPLRHRDAAGL